MNAWYKTPARILIADDDLDLLNLISFTFRNAGHETVSVTSGAEVLAALDRGVFSLLVLDINMPPPNGLDVCAAIRRYSNVPVLMLSARDREEDLLSALDAGADAYIMKPFSPRTLVARAGALVRRATADEPLSVQSQTCRLDIGESLLVHPVGAFVLTRLEVRVLRSLMMRAGTILTPSDLIKEVWASYDSANRNMLKQVVFRLRRKLSSVPETADALQTIAGGYVWDEEPKLQSPRPDKAAASR